MATRKKTHVLLVEDTLTLARSYIQFLRDEPYDVEHVDLGKKALEAYRTKRPDVMLLDLMLPDMDGMEVLRQIRETDPTLPVIMITAHGSVQTAVNAMQGGAGDFLVKPFNAERLKMTLKNTLEKSELTEIVKTYRQTMDADGYEGFVGSSLGMQAVYRIIDAAAPSSATVFITGESGTGKEVCAEAIRARSPRADGPMIALNCAAIPHELIESEIFGHVKGAFSGAVTNREGAAQLADGGTLFLDEICEMDPDLQAKLLRFLQTKTFRKVGGTKIEKVDVRLICATNKDPLAEVRAGRFREDLYYRLHVIPLQLPPLRERAEDIAEIAKYFLAIYSEQEGRKFQGFSQEAEDTLMSYTWPGNVRELQNVVQNVVVLNDGEIVLPEMLPPPLSTPGSQMAGMQVGDTPPINTPAEEPAASPQADQQLQPAAPIASNANVTTASQPDTYADGTPDFITAPRRVQRANVGELSSHIKPLSSVERTYIEWAIELCGGNIRTAATLLGIAPQTIYRKRTAWEAMDREAG